MIRIEERADKLASGLKSLLDQTKAEGIKFVRGFSQDVSNRKVSEAGRERELLRRAGQLLHTKMTPKEVNLYESWLSKLIDGFNDNNSNKAKKISERIVDIAPNLNFRNDRDLFVDTVALGFVPEVGENTGLKIDLRNWTDQTGSRHPLSFSLFNDQTLFSGSSFELAFNSRDHQNNAQVTRAEEAIIKRLKEQGFKIAG